MRRRHPAARFQLDRTGPEPTLIASIPMGPASTRRLKDEAELLDEWLHATFPARIVRHVRLFVRAPAPTTPG